MKQSYLITIVGLAVLFLAVFHGGLVAAGSGEQAAVTMETIVVTGERLDEYIANHPQLITVLDRKEIDQGNYLDLSEAIASMAGVDVRQAEGSMQTRISIRGSAGAGSILVLVNGRPLNTSQYGSVELASLPIDTVSRVTVFKPPIPVWLGPGGTAGAINIETREIRPGATPSEQNTQIKLNGGSYGTAGANLTYVYKQQNGGLMVTGGGGHRDGKRPNSDKDNLHLSLHWDRTMPQTTFVLDGRSYFSEHGISGPTYNPTPDARQRYAKGGLDFQVKGINESGDYSIKSYLDMSSLKDKLQSGTTSTLETIKGGLKGEHVWTTEEDGVALRLGGLAEHNRVDHTLSGTHERQQLSVHTQLDKEFEDVAITAGLRGDYVSDFEMFPAGSTGLSWSLGQSTLLKVGGGYAVMIPTFGQLYQPTHGSLDHVRGNPDLREEKVWSYSLSLEHTFADNRIMQAALFRSDHHDLIAYQRGDDLITRPLNVNRAHRQGLEVSLKYRISQINIDCSYILQQSAIAATNKELSYAPHQKATLSLKYTMPAWQTRWQVTLNAMSSQYSDIENDPDEKIGDWATLDLKIIQPLQRNNGSAELFMTITNLLDTDFEPHYGYPDDGLRGQVGLNMKF